MPDTATRPLTDKDRIDLLVEETARLQAEVDRLARQLQAPFPTAGELARQRMWANLRTVTSRLVGAASLFAVAAGALAIAAGVVRGLS